jgi:hypothetical protein
MHLVWRKLPIGLGNSFHLIGDIIDEALRPVNKIVHKGKTILVFLATILDLQIETKLQLCSSLKHIGIVFHNKVRKVGWSDVYN